MIFFGVAFIVVLAFVILLLLAVYTVELLLFGFGRG